MDQVTLVDRRIADGQKLVLQLYDDGFDFTAVFWLRAGDNNWWHLYIASKSVNEHGPTAGYRKIQTSLRKLPGITISLSDIKLIEASDPLTRDILKIRKGYTGTTPISFGGVQLGGILVEEALIYPPIPKEKRSSHHLGQRRLKTPVQQILTLSEVLVPLTPQEIHALGQLVAWGISPAQADYWVRKKREMQKEAHTIPAGTVVDAYLTAWWGEKPEDDDNPLLRVKTAEGIEGLTFLKNTEPVDN